MIQDVDGVIHTVGTLIDNKKKPQLSYKAMNRDAAINVATELNASANENSKKSMVMLGSAKAPPFLEEYLTRKFEAETHMFEQCPNL